MMDYGTRGTILRADTVWLVLLRRGDEEVVLERGKALCQVHAPINGRGLFGNDRKCLRGNDASSNGELHSVNW